MEQRTKPIFHDCISERLSCPMSLRISLEDLRRGRYEVQKNVLLQRFVRKRAIIKDPEDGTFPPRLVRSELLNFMVDACRQTGVIVVRAESGLGKSTAAKFILKNSAGGIMFCNCQSTSTSGTYWKGVAQALGIPREVYESSGDWVEILVTSVAAATSPIVLRDMHSWTDCFMDGFLSMCTGGGIKQEEASGAVVPKIDGLNLARVSRTPVIVFDDFNAVNEDDILFMKHLYHIVDAKKVLLFVLLQDEATANKLLNLNGWRRIAPLAGICCDISAPTDKEKKPEWKSIHWTRDQLEDIILSRFGNILEHMHEIEEGANPLDVLNEASQIMD